MPKLQFFPRQKLNLGNFVSCCSLAGCHYPMSQDDLVLFYE
jgi:hypothetical protein